MPKIEVNEEVFYTLADPEGKGRRWESREAFEEALTCAKAELDEDSDKGLPEAGRTLKIELNDTNRPDLWGTAGCARQLRIYDGGRRPEYAFFSAPGRLKEARYRVRVEESVKGVRPYLAGFVASGRAITDPMLRDMIQTQEKLAWNFGRKRRTVSMGLYRISIIKWPIIYKGVDPDSVSFVPLQWETPLTLREILRQHPKGKEYAFIQEHEKLHPLLTDVEGAVLSYPPIINSADLGAVQVGDDNLFVELTGTDQAAVTLAASIVACDLADNGFTIESVAIDYEYDTPFGRQCVTPYYFQTPVFCSLARVEKILGEKLSAGECLAALARMGVRAEEASGVEDGAVSGGDNAASGGDSAASGRDNAASGAVPGIRAYPPEYRNDFLHAADVVEDVMIGRGLSSFKSERPRAFTVGRLTPVTFFSRTVKEILVGLGYQEMIYNYLGSRRDLVEKMRGSGAKIIQIANPMTENYEYVRDSVLASLMASESVSGHSVYPHCIFELGKVAFRDDAENYGTSTRQYAGFLHADRDANFNTVSAQLQTLFYYLSRDYAVREADDARFIPGRAASIIYKEKVIGVFGEIHPEVLENWGITVPCTACEFDVEALL
ncbi:MAG: phenylalanine--tRNA ligase subunit beta [Spirochaetaceae bacterium]|jgi:phenylalanyl-tRNA synthetase beta chain|nr:phenylalanine--tRNA ligase subunit beta [Spirochaetaceae bacterium]